MSAFASYLTDIRAAPNLSAEREAELVAAMQRGCTRSREALCAAHLKLVLKAARKFVGFGHALEDLMAVGTVGLLKALDRFKADTKGSNEKAARVGTYAAFWIKAELNQFVMENTSAVKIGTTAAQKRLFFNLSRELAKLGVLDSSRISLDQAEQVAVALDVTADDVIEMCGRVRASPSLDQPVHRDDAEGETFASLIADNSPGIDDVLGDQQEHALAMSQINAALSQLSEREREIIAMRLADDGATLQDISDRFGISRERSRQVFERALEKTRAAALGLPMPKARTRKKKGATSEDAAPQVGRMFCSSCKNEKARNAFASGSTRCRACARHVAKMRALTAKLAA